LRKKILILFCSLFFIYSTGQTLRDLDHFNGFKSYKLGYSFSEYRSELVYSGTSDNILSYKHGDPSKIELLKIKPRVALFDFYKGDLYKILLYFDDFQGFGYDRCIKEFKLLFGNPTTEKETIVGNIWIEWKAEKVALYTQYFVRDNLFCIEFHSIVLERKKKMSEF